MKTVHVVMILGCDQHAETIRRMLDEASAGSWIVLSPDQARRAGHLAYNPLWPSTAPQVVLGFADTSGDIRRPGGDVLALVEPAGDAIPPSDFVTGALHEGTALDRRIAGRPRQGLPPPSS